MPETGQVSLGGNPVCDSLACGSDVWAAACSLLTDSAPKQSCLRIYAGEAERSGCGGDVLGVPTVPAAGGYVRTPGGDSGGLLCARPPQRAPTVWAASYQQKGGAEGMAGFSSLPLFLDP